MLHIDNTKTRIEVMTEKELRDKHERELLKNDIKIIGCVIAMMLVTYAFIVW